MTSDEVKGDRIYRVAFLALQKKLEEDGLRLNPKVVKRQITNGAKSLKVKPTELAALFRTLLQDAYEKTMEELDSIED